MRIETDFFDNDQGYEARGIVARVMPIGHYQDGPLMRQKIYRYLTLDCGDGRQSIAVRFVAQARVTKKGGESFLDTSELKPGQIVVSPGFVYEKITMSSPLMVEHLKALKTYKRKDIMTAEVDKSAGPIDLGEIKVPPNTTKQ